MLMIFSYADDATLWTAYENVETIQQHLHSSLDSACDWFETNKMFPKTKKTKQLRHVKN